MVASFAVRRSFSFLLVSSARCFFHSLPSLEESLKSAIQTKNFLAIPHLLSTCPRRPYPNPFAFFSSLPKPSQIQEVDEILQSLVPLRPRSHSHTTYFFLLFQCLTDHYLLPLSLAVLQQYIRSGSQIPQQTRLSLSRSWLHERRDKMTAEILSEVCSIGYPLDRNTCNYLLSSLCSVDEVGEAMTILNEMRRAQCEPDAGSYDVVIEAACRLRQTKVVAGILKEMVKLGVLPWQGTVRRAVSAMQANAEVKKAMETVLGLERDGFEVGFDCFEVLLEGCLKKKEYVLAGGLVMEMARRGLIPYIDARRKVVDGLASVGEYEFASKVRQRLVDLGS